MVKHLWTVLCQQALLDRFTNNVSIIGVIEKLDIRLELPDPAVELPDPLPTPTFSFTVLSLWRHMVDEPTATFVRVSCALPTGKDFAVSPEISFEIPAAQSHGRTIMRFNGLPFSEEGDYKIKVQQKNGDRWKTEHTTALTVRKLSPGAGPRQLN
jgi:hypothetical protein